MSGRAFSDTELGAYVDRQLDPSERMALEHSLRDRPHEAARLMADLALRDEIAWFMNGPATAAAPATEAAAHRLHRRVVGRRLGLAARRASRVAALLLVGWLAYPAVNNGTFTAAGANWPLPHFVDDAVDAHRAALSNPAVGGDPARLGPLIAGLGLEMSDRLTIRLGKHQWRLARAGMVPWDGGPAVLAVLQRPDGQQVSLFIAPAAADDPTPKRMAGKEDGIRYVFLQNGAIRLVAAGTVEKAELDWLSERAERSIDSTRDGI